MKHPEAGSTTIVYDTVSAESVSDIIFSLYDDVYIEPPYLEGSTDFRAFRDSWHHRRLAPGFRLVVHYSDNHAVGFAFGHALAPKTQWWNGLEDGLVERDFTVETGDRTFAIIELAVLRDYRRNKVGQTLHAHLLAENEFPRVTLLVRPEAIAALSFYQNLNYQMIGKLRPGTHSPTYYAMLLAG